MKSRLAALFLASAFLAIAADKPLAIVNAAFATSEDGPPEASDQDFVPGQTIYFSCQAEGFRKVDKPNDYGKQNMSLTFEIRVKDKSGTLLKPMQDGKIETSVTQEDKNWLPK